MPTTTIYMFHKFQFIYQGHISQSANSFHSGGLISMLRHHQQSEVIRLYGAIDASIEYSNRVPPVKYTFCRYFFSLGLPSIRSAFKRIG